MKILKFLLASFVITLSVTLSASACGCAGIPGETLEGHVARSMNRSNVVFQGKVIGFEYRKGIFNEFMSNRRSEDGKPIGYETLIVRFKVDRWWKGDLASEISLVTAQTRNSDGTLSDTSCEFHFIKDETYLVFAGLNKDAAMPQTSNCSLTHQVKGSDADADGIYKFLGVGTPANKPKSSM